MRGATSIAFLLGMALGCVYGTGLPACITVGRNTAKCLSCKMTGDVHFFKYLYFWFTLTVCPYALTNSRLRFYPELNLVGHKQNTFLFTFCSSYF